MTEEIKQEKNTEEKLSDAGTRKNDAEKNYKTAFRLMTGLVLVLLAFFIGMLYLQKQSIKQTAFYAEIAASTAAPAADKALPEDTDLCINVNTASKIELTLLPGIGDSRAQDIIDYRNEYGRFTQPEDLLKVKGIGESILENIRPYIVFEDPAP